MIKVLVVDDSALMRKLLVEILNKDPQIEVVGTAGDPYKAHDKINKLNPDVLTLDVEMPKMDGITFLKTLMRLRPMPVVMVSTLSVSDADVTLQALELGAVDYVSIPKLNVKEEIQSYASEIISKVKIAARARIRGNNISFPQREEPSKTPSTSNFKNTNMIIAMGASTGGTEALKDVICQLPSTTPGIVITQHIPPTFSKPFSERLNANSAMNIMQAENGQQILSGHGYVAPGDKHLEVVREGSKFFCRLLNTEPVNRHKPSVEVMFDSVAKNVGKNALCVLLTGMGDDGADAMGAMKRAGAPTIAQDEASSVVWGMPGEAVKRGNADDVLPLHKIAERILYYVHKHG